MVARLLLKRGAEVNMQGMHKETPLHDAARNGHFQVCPHATFENGNNGNAQLHDDISQCEQH